MSRYRLPRIRLERKALLASPEVVEATGTGAASFYPRLGGINVNSSAVGSAFVLAQSASYGHMYRTQPAVRAVIDYIARNVAQLGLKVYKRVSDEDREHVGDHPASTSLRKPNPQTPGQQFIYSFIADFLIYDNAFALKFRPEVGDTTTLLNIPPSAVGLVGRERFKAEAYRIWRADGTFFDVLPEYMIHWRGYDPEDPRTGFSKLETLRQELVGDTTARTAKTELDKSGLMPKGWIERAADAPEWDQAGMERFMESWANMTKNQRNKTPVLEDGMQFKQNGVSPEQAQLLESRQFVGTQVAAAFGLSGVPPENEEQRKQVYSDVFPPFCEMLCSYLDLHILQVEYAADDHYFEFNLDEKQMSDDRIKTLNNAAGGPIYTRNEARSRMNLPAIPEGNDIITPGNVVVGGKPSIGTMPVQDQNKPSQEGDHREAAQPREVEPKPQPELEAPQPSRELTFTSEGNSETIDEIAEVLHRLYRRQQKAYQRKQYNHKRFRQELLDDLMPLSQVPRDEVKQLAADFTVVVWEALQRESPQHVFEQAHAKAPQMAVVLAGLMTPKASGLVATKAKKHPALTIPPEKLEKLRQLRQDLGVPDEYAWQLAGFTDEEIDEMRAMMHATDLLAATVNASDAPST